MPRERFFRLPYEKRSAIREAIIDEFARVPFEHASINRMIRNAGISRGSFYTYFEDKEDALNYIFKDVYDRLKQLTTGILSENDGNYFDTWEQLLEVCLNACADKRFFQMTKHTFNSVMTNQMVLQTAPVANVDLCNELQFFMSKVDLEQLKIKGVEEFNILNTLLLANLAKTLVVYYQGEEDLLVIRRLHQTGIDILKYGQLCG